MKQYTRLVDFEFGGVLQPDNERGLEAPPSDETYSASWYLKGRDKILLFRDFLFRRLGRYAGFWMPSWTCDFQLAANIGASATTLTTKFNFGDARDGKNHLIIFLKNGTTFAREIVSITDSLNGNQAVVISSALGQAVTTAEVSRICYLNWCRLGSDTVEFKWHNPKFAEAKLSYTAIPKLEPTYDPADVW